MDPAPANLPPVDCPRCDGAQMGRAMGVEPLFEEDGTRDRLARARYRCDKCHYEWWGEPYERARPPSA